MEAWPGRGLDRCVILSGRNAAVYGEWRSELCQCMMPDDMSRPLIRGRGEGGGSRRLEASASEPGAPVIGILGTGDFSRSLARRLVASGYQVVVGSRTPKRSVALFPEEAEVTSQMEAASHADLLFVAVFPEHHSTLVELKPALAGKTLVDVSNALQINRDGPSNAEQLADLFPESFVVKGFNTISAWTLQVGPRDGSRQVFLCSDSHQAKSSVMQLCRRMGFVPVDMGLLSSSLEIENLPLFLFRSWRIPIICTISLFIVFYLYNFTRDVLHPYVREGKNVFYKMPIETVNVTFPSVALVMLALVYLPGLCAAFLQLWWGTKYNRFPNWLDRWLTRRKQFGLCSFLCAVLHVIYSLCLPMRKSARYKLLNAAVKQVTGVRYTSGYESLHGPEEESRRVTVLKRQLNFSWFSAKNDLRFFRTWLYRVSQEIATNSSSPTPTKAPGFSSFLGFYVLPNCQRSKWKHSLLK